MTSFLETFRLLSSFEPRRTLLKGAPWEEYVPWAIGQGLGPIAAYNLEYRLPGTGAPEWVRERLLGIYQGTVNDNVMKLVSFQRSVGGLEGRKILLMSGAAYADSIYPHVAFRPLPELRLLLRPRDLEPFAGFLKQQHYRPLPDADGAEGSVRALSDDHTVLLLFSRIHGDADEGLFERALPAPAYGPSIFRPALEDAILLTCLEQARAGYTVPYLSFVDLRELLLGAPSMAGPYSRPIDRAELLARAKTLRLERALYASASVVGRLFPDAEPSCTKALPDLRRATRSLIEKVIVGPLSEAGRTKALRGVDRLRRLFAGR